MPDERAAFFTTGQFAKLCSTTKETLFHYDSLGLLKPARVGENGYRYYAASQFFDFDLIAVLQSAGCSLQEIHAYMTHREPHAFAKLLRESERKLLLEQQKLEAMRRTLKNGVAATEAALSGKPGVPWLEKLPTAWYVATPVQGDVGSTNTLVRNIKDHLAYCDQSGLGEELSVGSIVTRASLLAGDYRESFYSTKLSQPVESPWLYERPAGCTPASSTVAPISAWRRPIPCCWPSCGSRGAAFAGIPLKRTLSAILPPSVRRTSS